jgi:hypothetical protein
MNYNGPDRRRNRVPPERPDPFYAEDHQESEQPSIVPHPELTIYMSIIKDERKDVKERPEGTYQRKMPVTNIKESESKKKGLLEKL